MRHPFGLTLLFPIFLATAAGCGGKPNAANITLRKKNQELSQKVERLESVHRADQATIREFEQSRGTPPLLPATRLSQLFTVHGIKLQRLTGPSDWDPQQPGDDGLKVYVAPIDETGDELKTAGSIVVEAFDLKRADQQRIGRWEFLPAEAREMWYGHLMQYEYVLKCPWQTIPTNEEITVKASFTDLLTGRTFEEQKVVHVKSLPTTQAAK